jgi:hypothetical protein
MNKFKWILIAAGMKLLKMGLRYRISNERKEWLQPIPGTALVNRQQYILDYCRNKSVLHVGFADAPYTGERIKNKALLHSALRNVTSYMFGIDTDENAVALYQRLTGDVNTKAVDLLKLRDHKAIECEILIAGEVLEHTINPTSFIEACTTVTKTGQELLITVPNYTSLDSIAASLHGTESVHPDHEWYFSPYTLLKKFNKENWELLSFSFGMYGSEKPNFIEASYPATGDCIIAVFKRK